MNENLYGAFLDVSDVDAARTSLNSHWDFRKAACQTKLEMTPPQAYFAIAKKDSQIIGFIIFDREKSANSFAPEEVSISPVIIAPEAQKLGLGKELVFSILKLFPSLKKISLITFTTMPASEFYGHIGFQEVKNKERQEQIDDPKLRETVAFFEWINPNI